MSDSVIGNAKTNLWSLGGTPNASQTPQPVAETPVATPAKPSAPADDAGAFNGANVLQAAALSQWSAGATLGSSQSAGGSWTAGWGGNTPSAGSGEKPAGALWSKDLVSVTGNQWTVDAPLAEAIRGLESAGKALDAMRAAALKEIQAIRQLASSLTFAQGGAVDGLKVGRQKAFENELTAAEQALSKNPPDIEAYRRDMTDARTILNPPVNPLNELGQSRNQLHWGKPVPGSQSVLAKLNALIDGAGHATTKITPTLYELRGNLIQAQSKHDTLKNAAEQRAKIQAKGVEFNQAKVAAGDAQTRYQQAIVQVGGLFADFVTQAKREFEALPASPAVTAALAELAKADNALKLNYFGSSAELLGKFESLAAAAGKTLTAPKALRESLSTAGRLQSEHHRAQDKARKLEQEQQRMQAGYDEVFRR
ncbi:hypothetical protein D3C72_182250 [compost metagenome]